MQVIDLITRNTMASIATPATALFASADESRVYAQVGAFLRIIDTGSEPGGRGDSAGRIRRTDRVHAADAARRSITIDVPSEAAVVSQPFEFGGWAANVRGFGGGPGVLTVHVWAFPTSGGDPIFVGSNYGRPRSDVAALFGSSYLNSGYQMTVTIFRLDPTCSGPVRMTSGRVTFRWSPNGG